MLAREDLITQSLQVHLRTNLTTLGYIAKVEILDAYSAELMDERYPNGLDKTLIATAFQFDDGGTAVELGSTLTSYLHTLDFLVFGHTAVWGRNVAYVVKQIFQTDESAIPLLDFSLPSRPILDWLPVEEVSTEREATSFEAKQWAQHAWSTRVRVSDETFAVT